MRPCKIFRAALVAAMLGGCRRHLMTEADCHAVLAKITTLELADRGFHDPELARLRTAELSERLRGLVASCIGLRARSDVNACVERATSIAHVTQVCLR